MRQKFSIPLSFTAPTLTPRQAWLVTKTIMYVAWTQMDLGEIVGTDAT